MTTGGQTAAPDIAIRSSFLFRCSTPVAIMVAPTRPCEMIHPSHLEVSWFCGRAYRSTIDISGPGISSSVFCAFYHTTHHHPSPTTPPPPTLLHLDLSGSPTNARSRSPQRLSLSLGPDSSNNAQFPFPAFGEQSGRCRGTTCFLCSRHPSSRACVQHRDLLKSLICIRYIRLSLLVQESICPVWIRFGRGMAHRAAGAAEGCRDGDSHRSWCDIIDCM